MQHMSFSITDLNLKERAATLKSIEHAISDSQNTICAGMKEREGTLHLIFYSFFRTNTEKNTKLFCNLLKKSSLKFYDTEFDFFRIG